MCFLALQSSPRLSENRVEEGKCIKFKNYGNKIINFSLFNGIPNRNNSFTDHIICSDIFAGVYKHPAHSHTLSCPAPLYSFDGADV